MIRRSMITAVVALLATAPTASASVVDRWKERLDTRRDLLDVARARHRYWHVRRGEGTVAERWKARNMEAARRRDREHRGYQVAYAERVVARHTPKPVAPTPFGPWAIPPYIVMCESGGRNLPPNSASASGYYQILRSTWALYGGLRFAKQAYLAPKWAQDIVASRIWDGGSGASQWVCA